MVQLLELENENIVLFNDENISESEVIEYLKNGRIFFTSCNDDQKTI